jgi:hypothetical protein
LGGVALALAVAHEGRISQSCLMLVERHDDGADFIKETMQLADHGRMLASAHDDVRFEQADCHVLLLLPNCIVAILREKTKRLFREYGELSILSAAERESLSALPDARP